MLRYVVITIIVLGLPSIAGAYGDEGPTGVIISLQSQSKEKLMSNCISSPRHDTRDGKVLSMNCKVSSFGYIGTYNGISYFSAIYNRVTVRERYLRKVDKNYKSGAKERYKISRKEIVLFEQHGRKLKPFWYNDEDGDEARFLEEVKLTSIRNRPVFDINYSTGGTAGSWQEFIIFEDQKWKYLDHRSFEKEIKLPESYEIRSPLLISIQKLEAGVVIYKESEPNCCPSAEIYIKLDLVDNKLVFKGMRVEPIN